MGNNMSNLYFRLGEMKGFTAIELANRNEGYANPIRELLQNSLDASREAGSEKCEVNVYIETISKSDIPHIKEYAETLNKAIQTHEQGKSLNANAKRVVESIKRALQEQQITVLMFSDNGTGMSQAKMDAILTGTSIHDDEESGGSFGVGHLSSYSLSSLRYVLYATKYMHEGKTKVLFTGSPILAGHLDDNDQRGSRGRIVEKIPENESNPQFAYLEDFPSFVAPKMNQIDRGTIVIILGLSEEWNQEAEYAIVSNFFHAICHDALSVKIHQGNQAVRTIGESEVKLLVAGRKEEKNTKGENILSGKAAYQALSAVMGEEKQKEIKLSNNETVYVCIETDRESLPTIVLVRNGMLIARHDRMLSGEMNSLRKHPDIEPFTAVIDVDKEHSPELFKLVKGAEGPYHNKLEKNRLTPAEEKKLKNLFKELSGKIKEHLQEIKRDTFDLPLFTIPNEASTEAGGNNQSSGQDDKAKPQASPRPPKPKPEPNPDPDPNPRPTPVVVSRNLESNLAVRYESKGNEWIVNLRVVPRTQNAKDEVYLSFCLGEDNDNQSAKAYLDFVAVEMNGQAIEISDIRNQVKLGRLMEANQYDIVATIKRPPNTADMQVALLPILGLKQAQTDQS